MYREEFSYERRKLSEFEAQGTACPRCGRQMQLRASGAFEVLLCWNCGYCYEYRPKQMILTEN